MVRTLNDCYPYVLVGSEKRLERSRYLRADADDSPESVDTSP
jgi:hypothetical protein